jgi:hypothetical protein
VTGLIVNPEHDPQTTLPGIPAMLRAIVKPIAINYAMFIYPITLNLAKNEQIHSW